MFSSLSLSLIKARKVIKLMFPSEVSSLLTFSPLTSSAPLHLHPSHCYSRSFFSSSFLSSFDTISRYQVTRHQVTRLSVARVPDTSYQAPGVTCNLRPPKFPLQILLLIIAIVFHIVLTSNIIIQSGSAPEYPINPLTITTIVVAHIIVLIHPVDTCHVILWRPSSLSCSSSTSSSSKRPAQKPCVMI